MVAPDLLGADVVTLGQRVSNLLKGKVSRGFVQPPKRCLIRDGPVCPSTYTNEVCTLEFPQGDRVAHSVGISRSGQVDKDDVRRQDRPGPRYLGLVD